MYLSVIICTHNPRIDYFGRTLAALASQTLGHDGWELLIVDNRSELPVAGRFDFAWRPDVRIMREETLGLTPARLRGIREARGDVLVFVDDDNVLDPDFLEVALRVAGGRPWLGAWSGQCRPEFESEPEAWTRRYWGNLAIREFDQDVWSNLPRLPDTMPCGAGLCARRAVADEYLRLHDEGARRFQFDRSGTSLLSGGDNDLAACACTVGLGVGLVSELKLTHIIPANRLTRDYLARLSEGIAFSAAILDSLWGLASQKKSVVGQLADQIRICRLASHDRHIQRASLRGRKRALSMMATGEIS